MKKILCIITTGFAVGGGLTAVMMNYYRMLWSEEEYNKIYQIDFVSQNDIAEQLAEEISRHGCRYYKLPSRKKQTFSHYKEL